MTKQQTIDMLKTQLPGFYSAEQVIELISKIEDSGGADFNIEEFKEQIEEAITKVLDNMNPSDMVDFDSTEFYLDGNEIKVDDITVNTGDIVENVMSGVNEMIGEFFEEDDCGC